MLGRRHFGGLALDSLDDADNKKMTCVRLGATDYFYQGSDRESNPVSGKCADF